VSGRLPVAAIVLALVTACEAYAPTNQYDTRYDLTAEIVGPDTVSTYGDVITLSVVTTPPWTGAGPVWSVSSPSLLQPVGGNQFRSSTNTYAPQVVHVLATLGPHVTSRDIVVRDVVARTGLLTLVGNALVPVDTLRLTSTTDREYFRAVALDSGATAVFLQSGDPALTTDFRTAGLVDWDGTYVTGKASGRTWVVVSFRDLVDSALVIVP
jgi:hypothetical protein